MSIRDKANFPQEQLQLRWERIASTDSVTNILPGSAILVGRKVYCVNEGGSIHLFDLQSREWTSLQPILSTVTHWHAAQLADDKIFYFGGNKPMEFDTVLGTARVLETVNKGAEGTIFLTAVFASWRSEIITFGGYSSQIENRTNETHAFNVVTKKWRKFSFKGEQPTPRNAHGATVYGSKMYIYGGYDRNTQLLGDLWILELANFRPSVWSRPKTYGIAPDRCSSPTLNNLHGQLIVCGGSTGSTGNQFRYVQVFHVESNTWLDESSPQVVVDGNGPNPKKCYRGLDMHMGILYFTHKDVYVLSNIEEWSS